MKKTLSILVILSIAVFLYSCDGSFGGVSLQESIEIPENGMIQKNIIQRIRNENAIAVFTGKSGEISYEWTIFGSDILEVKDVNLSVVISERKGEEVIVTLSQEEPFGFSALLSVYLADKWEMQGATGYEAEKPVVSVSLTGSKATILNMSLDGTIGTITIRGEELFQESTEAVEEGQTEETEPFGIENDSYLSDVKASDDHLYTNGKDQYLTDPVPEGKPNPVEPDQQEVNTQKALSCTFSIECSAILNHLEQLEPGKLEMVPSNGVILSKTSVTFYEGESVFDVLQRVCRENKIHMEASWTPIYNSAYVEGISNLYEFDCGSLSGWMYRVNGWYPNYGCSRYQLQSGDIVEWRYTCDLGKDIDGGYATGG